MIVWVTEKPRVPEAFLQTWGRSTRKHIRVVHVDDLGRTGELRRGTYLFADHETMSDERRARIVDMAHAVDAAGMPVLNHPDRVLRRFGLLRDLHERGVNRAAIHRLSDAPADPGFPVFLRRERDHRGAISPLLRTPGELAGARRALIERGEDPAELLVLGFVDTSDPAGVYRKYSWYRFGDRLVRGHLLLATDWHVKYAHAPEEAAAAVAEKERFVFGAPDALDARVLEIFEIAGIEFGRVDLGLLDGRPQVWEINTNPWLCGMPDTVAPALIGLEARQAARFRAAFEALDAASPRKGWFEARVSEPADSAPVPRRADSADELRRLLREAEDERDRALKRLRRRAQRSRAARARAATAGWSRALRRAATRRRENRTPQAPGYDALPVLKTGSATRPVPPRRES